MVLIARTRRVLNNRSSNCGRRKGWDAAFSTASYVNAFDAANRITGFTNSAYTTENATYNYDAAGQVTGADRTGSSNDETYTYDDTGNRTNAGYSTGAANRLLSDGVYTYTYDDEGNRLTKIKSGEATTYTWDYRNRLTGVTIVTSSGVRTIS